MKAALPCLLALVVLSPLSGQQPFPALPDPLKTAKGIFTHPKVFKIHEGIIRILHDGGITPLTASDLPADVAASLGLTPGAPLSAYPALPDPLVVGGRTYNRAKILSVDPDGINVAHDSGKSKVPYEVLHRALQQSLGGFDPQKAATFRATAASEQRKALEESARQQSAQQASANTGIAAQNKAMENQEPEKESPSIRLSGRSVTGGRSTDVTWSTTWGSFSKESTTKRVLAITVATVARTPQQAEVEVLFLWRNQASKDMEITTTGRKTATVVDGRPLVIAAQEEAEDTHNRYNALGVEQKTGKRYIAWVARALDAKGRVVAVCASIPSYEKYGYTKRE